MKTRNYPVAFAVLVCGLGWLVLHEPPSPGTPAAASIPLVDAAAQIATRESSASSGPTPPASQPEPVPGRAHVPDGAIAVPEGNALELLARLRPLADAGDAGAALKLYLKMYECHSELSAPPHSDEQLRIWSKAGVDVNSALAEHERKLDDCAGAEASFSERGHWLERAAEAGSKQARMLYVTDTRAVIGDESDALRDPDKIRRYKQTAMRYLHSLSRDGSAQGMLGLAGAYDSGVLAPSNPELSYAYYRALHLARPGLVSENLIRAQRIKIPPDRLLQADALARRLAGNCCND